MILSNILSRTFFIKANEYGTAFTLHVENEEYLITAKHLLDDSLDSFELKIFTQKRWYPVQVSVVGHGRGEIDISVLKLPRELTSPQLVVTPSIGNLIFGQDVYFLGFPYKMWGDIGDVMNGYPCPFAKKGTLSSIGLGDPKVLYVDAINNEGFSGGPLCFAPSGDVRKVNIAGVVSKFRIEHEAVLNSDGNPTGDYVPYNTGFLVAYGINHALQIIEAKKSL